MTPYTGRHTKGRNPEAERQGKRNAKQTKAETAEKDRDTCK